MPTTYNKSQLATFFAQGDIPTGNDYENLIYSQVNIVETALQSMAGPLSVTKLITPLVSASNANVTGLFTIAALSANTGTFTGTVSAASLNVTGDVLANAGSVNASAMRASSGFYVGPGVIISAAGTTQATGALLTAVINRLQGVTNGTTTGFSILANRTGWIQYIINETAVSANLWPPIGGQINDQGINNPWPILGGNSYTILHSQASAYGVV